MTTAKLLIVEDDGILAANLESVVRALGYGVVGPVATGEEAIALLERCSADLVLMDIELAGELSGIETAAIITGKIDLPVVFVTGFSQDSLLEQAKGVAPYGYLVKPVPERELAATVAMSLQRHSLDRQLRQSREALAESEARYRALFEHVPVGIFRNSLEGRLLLANQEMAAILGCSTPEEALREYSNIAERLYVNPARRQDYLFALQKDGELWNFELEGRRKDGEHVWLLVNARLTTIGGAGEGANSQVIDGFALDITERKKADLALRESERRHRHYLQSTPYGVFLVDSLGGFQQVNPAACRLSGYSEAELLVMNLADLLPNEGRDAGLEHFATVRHEGQNEGEFVCCRKGGERRWWSIKAVASGDGNFLGFCNDITERKTAEEALRLSEERNRLLSDLTMEGILLHKNGVAIDLNLSLARLFGIAREELLNRNFMEFVHPDDQPKVRENIVKEYAPPYPIRMKRADQSVLWVEIESRNFDQGSDTWRVSAVRDITERRRTEEALRASQERLQSIFRVAPTGIGVVRERIFQEVNPQICAMTGYSEEELLGQSARMVYPSQEDFDYVGREKYRQIGEKGTGVVETRWQHKDGTILDVLMASTPLDSADLSRGVTFTVLDITERKRIEEEKRALQGQLQQAQKMEAIGTLAGGIAHDFNNILSAILGYAELGREDCPPGSLAARDLDQVIKAADRAKELVRQILAFSRQAKSERIALHPTAIVKETVKLLHSTLPATITIRQEVDPRCGMILADPTEFHQVLMNLCTNAYHAMEEQGGTLTIRLEHSWLSEGQQDYLGVRPGEVLHLEVSDSGRGISPEVGAKIFDPYFTTKATGKGTGMGLAIVHGIVVAMGGAIGYQSRPGEGTTFTVTLPAEKSTAPLVDRPVEIVPVGRERVLFVDDEPMLAEMGQAMLERLGYTVTSRTSSLEALATFSNQPDAFDLVITDQTMPGMTGVDLARRMLQIRPQLPIILCTGYSTQISAEKAQQYGIRGFALKPLTRKDIATMVRKVLGNTLPTAKPAAAAPGSEPGI
jgi:PAS domain S-box-containing protein